MILRDGTEIRMTDEHEHKCDNGFSRWLLDYCEPDEDFGRVDEGDGWFGRYGRTVLNEDDRGNVTTMRLTDVGAEADGMGIDQRWQDLIGSVNAVGKCCTDCLMVLANGDTSGIPDEDLTDWQERFDAAFADGGRWAGWTLVPGSDAGFSHRFCDVCQRPTGGDRTYLQGLEHAGQ